MSTSSAGGVTFDIVEEQWIGSRETRDDQGEISRQLEWFDDKADAEHFARTGLMPGQETRRKRTCGIRSTTELSSPLCGEPAVGKRWGEIWACRAHMGFGER